MRNVEIKMELRDPALARTVALHLGAIHAATFHQIDTYFKVPSGRLKKRESDGEPEGKTVEYIVYERPDKPSAKISEYSIYDEIGAKARFGNLDLPRLAVVDKKREVFLLDNVRIHLDDVKGLGKFLEFEAIVSPSRNVRTCREQLDILIGEFKVVTGEVIAVSYCDMVLTDEPDATEQDGQAGARDASSPDADQAGS